MKEFEENWEERGKARMRESQQGRNLEDLKMSDNYNANKNIGTHSVQAQKKGRRV